MLIPVLDLKYTKSGSDVRPEKASLYFHTKNSGGHSFLLSSAGGESYESEVHPYCEVWIQSLDQVVIDANWPRPDFIKIDVQDLEVEVIEGAQKMIEHFHPSFLIECNHERLLKDEEYFRTFDSGLLRQGYKWNLAGKRASISLKEWQETARNSLAAHQLYGDYFFRKV